MWSECSWEMTMASSRSTDCSIAARRRSFLFAEAGVHQEARPGSLEQRAVARTARRENANAKVDAIRLSYRRSSPCRGPRLTSLTAEASRAMHQPNSRNAESCQSGEGASTASREKVRDRSGNKEPERLDRAATAAFEYRCRTGSIRTLHSNRFRLASGRRFWLQFSNSCGKVPG
jgi:hypothetical protein